MDHINLDIPTKHRYSVFADCVINDLDSDPKNTELQNDIPNANTAINLNLPTKKPPTGKSPPIYIHGKIGHLKLLDTLKSKYQNAFQTKFTSNKLKIMFTNIKDFTKFKALRQRKH